MQQQDDVPLTPMVVDCVTFDRAPLGRRGYNEDQVDDFLDRIHGTLCGTDKLSAADVREVIFDSAPLIRRGYHEEQGDDFLDLVVEEFDRRERTGGGRPPSGFPPPPPARGAPAASRCRAPAGTRGQPPAPRPVVADGSAVAAVWLHPASARR